MHAPGRFVVIAQSFLALRLVLVWTLLTVPYHLSHDPPYPLCHTGMDLAGDAAFLVIFIVLAMAVVGMFVTVYLGSKLVNEVMRTHISVLQKRGLAEEFIVADLESTPTSQHMSPASAPQVSSSGSGNGSGSGSRAYETLSTGEEVTSSLHRDEDLEYGGGGLVGGGGSGSFSTSRPRQGSSISEAQERMLARLGLICSDADIQESYAASRQPTEVTQRLNAGRRGR